MERIRNRLRDLDGFVKVQILVTLGEPPVADMLRFF